MFDLYDNGALLIGNINRVIKEIEDEIEKDIDEIFVDKQELLFDLKELRKNKVEIVMINYDNPMGYSLDYWHKDDIVRRV